MATNYRKLTDEITIVTLDEQDIRDFAKARNLALKKVTTHWAFFLDQDEKLSRELQKEIISKINNDNGRYVGYRVKRIDSFLGRVLAHGENSRVRPVRLGLASKGAWVRPVHEHWELSGNIGKLNTPITHTPHRSISTFLDKIDRYSEIEAGYRLSIGKRSTILHIMLFPVAKFIRNYILRLGFLDGTAGAIMAFMMSLHSYLTWTKLYLLCHKKS